LTGQCMRTLIGHYNSVFSVCFSPDGKTFISGGYDNTMKLWDISTDECVHTFEGHTCDVNSVCFSPDGKTLLSGSDDKTMKLWDVSTRKCLRTFKGHTDYVDSVCFSPNGKFALSYGGGFKLWNIASGRCIYSSVQFDESMDHSVCFTSDGTKILVEDRELIHVHYIDHELEFPGWVDWDDGALPYVKNFLTFTPSYSESDFDRLITELQNRGYGWLRPEGVRAKLQELSNI